MKHLTAILIKFVIIAVVLEIVLNLLTNLSFGDILLVSLIVTAVAYLVGDLLILPQTNNTIATLVDFALSWATIYAFNYFYPAMDISVTDAFIASAVIAIGEWMFHKYMASNTLRPKEENNT